MMGLAAPTIWKRIADPGGVFNGTARSGSLPARNELEVFHRHLLEECLVLALWKRPQDRRGLLAGVPVFAAADPDGPRKGVPRRARNFSVAATVGETAALLARDWAMMQAISWSRPSGTGTLFAGAKGP
jgi:hypothetical protein